MTTPAKAPKRAVLSPLDVAVENIRAAIKIALDTAQTATMQAIYAGHLMNEAKALVPHGQYEEWLRKTFHEVKYDRGLNWRKAAANSLGLSGVGALQIAAPMSVVLAPQAPGLNPAELEARQLYFDWASTRTIKDCLASVVVDGQEAHALTRAHNGRSKGGHGGEDRKDFSLFYGESLAVALAHAKHWKSHTAAQRHEALEFSRLFLGGLPPEAVEFFAEAAKEEASARAKGRAPKPAGLSFAVQAAKSERRKK